MTTTTWFDARRRPSRWVPLSVCAGLGLVVALMQWRGSDFPAQLFRIDQIRAHGFVLWNSQWYGGHPTLEYSVLTPLLGALIGPVALGLIAGLVATAVFDRITRDAATTRLASAWFAAATVINLVVGRIAFAVGLALALVAVRGLQQNRRVVALASALLTSLASPVAGAFLAIVAIAWALARGKPKGMALGVIALTAAPIVVVRLAFPVEGQFPFTVASLVFDLAISAAIFWLARDQESPVVRWSALLYGAACVFFFVVPTALGGNISRLAQLLGGPIALLLAWPQRHVLLARWRIVLVGLALPLLAWQWLPTIDGIAYAGRDPSTTRTYYQPLVAFLTAHGVAPGRVEIPFTARHWETAFVAESVPLARGWERQLDMAYNPSFYDHTLDAKGYGDWLVDNAVSYVALPDAPLDESSFGEHALLNTDLPYLQAVWSNPHWKVWKVTSYHGLVDGPGIVAATTTSGFIIESAGGDVVVHIRYSPHWSIKGPGCVAPGESSSWIHLVGLAPGRTVVEQALRGTLCPPVTA